MKTRITRKDLEQRLEWLNEMVEQLIGKSYVYVLDYDKYFGGYRLSRRNKDRIRILCNDYITPGMNMPAREMYAYITAVYNTMCEFAKLNRLK